MLQDLETSTTNEEIEADRHEQDIEEIEAHVKQLTEGRERARFVVFQMRLQCASGALAPLTEKLENKTEGLMKYGWKLLADRQPIRELKIAAGVKALQRFATRVHVVGLVKQRRGLRMLQQRVR